LYKISDATGTIISTKAPPGSLITTEVATGNAVNKGHLSSDDIFLLDVGSQIFVWIGKGSSPQEKKSGLQIAVNYIAKNQLPEATPISRILEGGENAEFNSYLTN
jgi:gelsolin